jgi:hypothetical protein
MLTSRNVTTNRMRATDPTTAICGVTADTKSMDAKVHTGDWTRNSAPRLAGYFGTGHPLTSFSSIGIGREFARNLLIRHDPFCPQSGGKTLLDQIARAIFGTAS